MISSRGAFLAAGFVVLFRLSCQSVVVGNLSGDELCNGGLPRRTFLLEVVVDFIRSNASFQTGFKDMGCSLMIHFTSMVLTVVYNGVK